MIGKSLLHYRIVSKIGAGGQGAVYEAVNMTLGRTVVLKVLPPELTANEVNLERFEREARLASALDHPNICAIHDLALDGDVHFIIMQHVAGSNVRELVNGRPLALKTAVSIAIQVCDALAAAHQQGIIHRDIKANNVMVTRDGKVKILDFGLAKLLDQHPTNLSSDEVKHLTEIGTPYGTPTYAAPEQAQGLPADARADVFSTGVLLYEMLVGRWPFDGKTAVDVRYAVVNQPPRRLAEARPTPAPARLQEILDRAMAKAPGERYQNISEMRDDLRKVLRQLEFQDNPEFEEEVAPSAPKHLARQGRLTRSIDSVAARTGVSRKSLTFASLTLAALIVIPVLILIGVKYRSGLLVGATGEGVALRLHGSNTIGAKLAPALAEAFLRKQGATNVRTINGASADEAKVVGLLPGNSAPTTIEINSHGSATAFMDLIGKTADVGLSSRKIEPAEIQKLGSLGDMTSSASEHILGLDGIAVIVNRSNSIDALSKEQVAKIFSGEITNWSQVQGANAPIKVYARDDKSGTFDSFKTLVLDRSGLISGAARFEDSLALSDAVATDPNGIGFIGLPYIHDAKAIAIAEGSAPPLMPNSLTVSTEDYILSRRLYLYTPAHSTNVWVGKFLEFALSDPGQQIVGENGFVAQTVKSESTAVAANAPGEYKRLTNGAERVSLDFRFRRGGKDLDNKARLDLDRVVSFVADLKFSGQNILLFGFADDGLDNDLEISKERAQLVAEQFKRRGIDPGIVTGFGDLFPVASSATEDGKEKNRRVELWLKK
ncbi:MAG TPA: protein kinase [Pyrinomonadaceae bacterium]|nr:protein kinase [Pyrinomonadaceae bacterium]